MRKKDSLGKPFEGKTKKKGDLSKRGSGESPSLELEIGKRIEQKAYELFQKRGYSHGNDLEDWLQAEQQVFFERNADPKTKVNISPNRSS